MADRSKASASRAEKDRIERLQRRYDAMRSLRGTYETQWRDLLRYVLPRKSSPLLGLTPGTNQMADVYDSTAIHANEMLAASMQGSLTSAATRWFRLKMRLAQLNELWEVQDWLETVSNLIYDALNQSNFAAEVQEVYLDLGAFGVGALLMMETAPRGVNQPFGGFRFQSQTIGSYVISEGPDGAVNTIMRCFSMPAHTVRAQWGAAELSDRLTKTLEAGNLDEPVEIVHAIYPRVDDEYAGQGFHDYVSCYWIASDKTKLQESGYYEFPALVPRWTKSSNEMYGRGPGHSALPDVKTLNKAIELNLRAWDKAIDPPLLIKHEAVLSPVRLMPSGQTYVTDTEAIKPLMSGAKFDLTQIETEKLRINVRNIFFNNELQLPGQAYMTAREVELRYELMQRILGPTLGRLESELLSPLIRRAFLMMLRARALPAVPPVVVQAIKAGFSEMDIMYEGPLARAQRYSDVQAISRAMTVLAPIAELKPDILDNFDFDKVATGVARDSGVKNEVLRRPEAVRKMRQARAALQAQGVQQQQALASAKAGKDAAQAGSAMADTAATAQEAQSGATPSTA